MLGWSWPWVSSQTVGTKLQSNLDTHSEWKSKSEVRHWASAQRQATGICRFDAWSVLQSRYLDLFPLPPPLLENGINKLPLEGEVCSFSDCQAA